ncbi:MAG TPA: FAD-binding oxidoreductase, partial [Dehalococcoidia bacterium]|nr:FAD-binding oxidoreductase [Dehalococcoidia bacterium]
FASAAKRLGARICQEAEVTGMGWTDHVWSITTARGKLQAPTVVVAAGAWTGQIGTIVGVDIPVHPVRRHLFVTTPVQEVAKNAPMVVELCNGFWFRREGPGLIFGMRNPEERESYDTGVDWEFLPIIAEVASHRLPFLGEIGVCRAQAGLYEDTPDANPIIGTVPGMKGLYLACGFSGHGFMHSPAVGRIVAELVLEKLPASGFLPFALERFKFQTYQKERCFV